nr:hypothetical protein [uncultured Lichenicoccus sp.]
MPYLFSDTFDFEPTNTGKTPFHDRYEPEIQKILKASGIEPQYFKAGKGDVRIWHANLIHGGSQCKGHEHLSRKALVCHYFADGAQRFHDLAAGSSRFTNKQTDIIYKHDGIPGTFDADLYLQANPDVAKAKQNPMVHDLRYGRKEGRPLR